MSCFGCYFWLVELITSNPGQKNASKKLTIDKLERNFSNFQEMAKIFKGITKAIDEF